MGLHAFRLPVALVKQLLDVIERVRCEFCVLRLKRVFNDHRQAFIGASIIMGARGEEPEREDE